jgi:hypothetical protein
MLALLGVALLLPVACVPGAQAADGGPSPYGAMAGVVVNLQGIPQMGATVALMAGDGRTLRRVYTDDKGAFVLERVLPGLYSLRVTLASYLPVIKENVLIQPGVQSFLSINLSSLFNTIDLLRGQRQAGESEDDWAWVLRSAGANRPLFRYLPAPSGSQRWRTQNAALSPTVVRFSGGGQSSTMGSEADFNTSFAVANQIFDNNTSLLLSGNLGYERRTPATAFRGVLRREFANGSTPEVSVTLRQVFLPEAFWPRGATTHVETMQSLSVAAGNRYQLNNGVRLEFGFLYDSISFLSRLNNFSPYGRIIFEPDDRTSVQLSYTEGAPRVRLPGGGALYDMASELAVFPRFAVRGNAPAVQHGRHLEASYTSKFGAATKATVGLFGDEMDNLVVTSLGRGRPPLSLDFFPDVFSQNYSFSSGNYRTSGIRAGLQQKLSERLEATLAYSYSGVLSPARNLLYTNDPDELRGILKMQRHHAVTGKVGADIPLTRTRVFAAYKWVAGPSISIGDLYDESLGQAEPNLNVVIRQPLPSSVLLPARIEAVADFRNLLAQGYVPIITADGQRLLLVQNVRSFRGGFSFRF